MGSSIRKSSLIPWSSASMPQISDIRLILITTKHSGTRAISQPIYVRNSSFSLDFRTNFIIFLPQGDGIRPERDTRIGMFRTPVHKLRYCGIPGPAGIEIDRCTYLMGRCRAGIASCPSLGCGGMPGKISAPLRHFGILSGPAVEKEGPGCETRYWYSGGCTCLWSPPLKCCRCRW